MSRADQIISRSSHCCGGGGVMFTSSGASSSVKTSTKRSTVPHWCELPASRRARRSTGGLDFHLAVHSGVKTRSSTSISVEPMSESLVTRFLSITSTRSNESPGSVTRNSKVA